MSKEITYCNEQEGYGDWNKDLIKEPEVNCSICYDVVEVYYKNGKAVWTKGQNAEPLSEGRCCNYCNDTKVIPARIKSIAGIDPIKIIEPYNSDLLEMQEMLNSLKELQLKQEKETK